MKRSHPSSPPPHRSLDAHHRFSFACLVALAVYFLAGAHVVAATRLLLAWNAFALTVVVLAWIVLCTKDPYEVRRGARIQDGSATALFVFVISAASVSLLTVGALLRSAKLLSGVALLGHVAVSVGAVVFSWMLVHTLFALRYAHLYYLNAREKERDHAVGGLIFPGHTAPDYLDFAYFSFVVGMTCQVSDVQISSPQLRRLALVHGLISFAFNTAILAMFVNIVAGLF